MAWLIRNEEESLKMSGKVNTKPGEKLAATEAPKTVEERLRSAMVQHSPKIAENEAPEKNVEAWSTSGKVEVASTESRLNQLRAALERHNAEMQTNNEDLGAEKVPASMEDVQPVIESIKSEAKAPLPQYSSLSGIDVDKLPKNIPEVKGVSKLVEIEKLQTTMKLEVRDLKDFTVNADRINSFISNQELTGISEEFYKRIVAATTAKREEAVKKAGEIVADVNAEIGRLQDKIGEINPMAIKAFDVLSRKPSVEMPKGYKTGGGAEFWNAANDNSALAFISALENATKKAA